MKTMIAIPCMDTVPTQFMERLLALYRPDGTMIITARSSLIYDARNILSKMAIDQGYDRIMWLDSDMVFPSDLLDRLSADMDTGKRYVSGMYFTRKNPIHPVIYRETGYRQEAGGTVPYCTPVDDKQYTTSLMESFDYTVSGKNNPDGVFKASSTEKENKYLFEVAATEKENKYLFEVKATGMGCCLMETSVIQEVFNHFGLPFTPMPGFGEDLSFCRRCEELGIQMWCDSSLQCGHIAQKVVGINEYKGGLVL